MAYKEIQIYCPKEKFDEIALIASQPEVIEFHSALQKDKTTYFSLLVASEKVQLITDRIQHALGKNPTYRTIVMTVDTVIPKPDAQSEDEAGKKSQKFIGVSREELLEIISKGVMLDYNFFLLAVFSTIVAAIGLLEDNVAVVIGAMVIAPLLGPNLALAFAASLGDMDMMKQAIKTNLVGFSACLLVAFLIGKLWPYNLESQELLMRTDVGFDGVILAIVSGATAVLSLTKGISSVMVGVMVAVALLPPATTFGIMLGAEKWPQAYGAFLLLTVNIVCVNLSAKLALLYKGVKPRTWYEKKSAKSTIFWYLLFWAIALSVLLVVIYLKSNSQV